MKPGNQPRILRGMDLHSRHQRPAQRDFEAKVILQVVMEDALMAWVSSSQGLAKSIMPTAHAQPCHPRCCENHLPAINMASKKTWPESAVVRRFGRKAGAIHITPTRLDLHPAPPALRRSMTPASTACKSCVQGDGICEMLMREEGTG